MTYNLPTHRCAVIKNAIEHFQKLKNIIKMMKLK
jgi:hypothetical protein